MSCPVPAVSLTEVIRMRHIADIMTLVHWKYLLQGDPLRQVFDFNNTNSGGTSTIREKNIISAISRMLITRNGMMLSKIAARVNITRYSLRFDA